MRKRLGVPGVLKILSGERGYVVVVALCNKQVPLLMFNNWVFKPHQFLFLFWPTFGQADKNSQGIKEHEIEADIPDLIHWNYCLAYISHSQNIHYPQISSRARGYSEPMSNKVKVLAPIISFKEMRPCGSFPLVTITLFTSVVSKKIQSKWKQGLHRLKPIIGNQFRESVVIPTPPALNRQILLDLKPGKQEQCLSVNVCPWCHGPTH